MAGFGAPELLIVLVVVLLVFGVGRISKLGSEMGKGIQAFRQGLREGQEDPENEDQEVENKL